MGDPEQIRLPGGASAGFSPGVAGSYKCYVLFGLISLLLKMYVMGSISCGRASCLGRSGKGAKRLLVSIAGLAVGMEAVLLLLLLTASGKWRLPGPLPLKLSISVELPWY